MQIITNNPFKILGLLADCSERDIHKQKGLIQRIINIGKDVSFETDIDLANKCTRDETSISTAFAKIEQIKNRVTNGLFWFVNANYPDKTALDFLIKGDKEKAVEIWSALTQSDGISYENCFAVHNLSTLKLGLACSNGTLKKSLLEEGIILKAKLINSDFIGEIVNRMADETFSVNPAEMITLFAEELIANINPYLDNPHGFSFSDFIAILKSTPGALSSYVFKKFGTKLISVIESKTTEAENKIRLNKSEGYRAGEMLYEETSSDLFHLRSFVGSDDLQYTMLADKLAKVMLECGIEYFNELSDTETDPGEESMKLFNYAENIACGSQLRDRIKENKKTVQAWIDDKPNREKTKRIKTQLTFLNELLEEFESKDASFENAKMLIKKCKPVLKKVKKILGKTDELYLRISSRVAADALEMFIAEVNEKQKTINDALSMKWMFTEAGNCFILINTIDMNTDFKTRYNTNKDTLRSLCKPYEIDTSTEKPVSAGAVIAGVSGLLVFLAFIADAAFNEFKYIKEIFWYIKDLLGF